MYHLGCVFAPYVLNVPCAFLNTLYQVKAIVIGISEANPVAIYMKYLPARMPSIPRIAKIRTTY